MATKTIACPECGATVAPGRYACAECGALVAAVSPAPRVWTAETTTGDASEQSPPPVAAAAPAAHAAAPAPPAAAIPAGSADSEPDVPIDPRLVALAEVMPPLGPSEAPKRVRRPRQPRAAGMEDAGKAAAAATASTLSSRDSAPQTAAPVTPTAAPVTPTAAPVTRPATEVDDDARRAAATIDENQPLAAHVRPPTSGQQAPSSLSAILTAEPPEVAAQSAGASARPAAAAEAPPRRPPSPPPVWPPADDRGPALVPPIRTPAGAYLAPSAVLPPLDAPLPSRNGHEASPNGHVHAPLAGSPSGGGGEPSGDGGPKSRSLAETMEAFGITAEMPRRLVAGGAAIAGLGFLLPWIDALGGTGALLDSYLDYWGLSGPGHWIVAALLLALVAAAVGDGSLAKVPVGPVGIAFAGILLGLLWPYLFGVAPKSVGVWIVLAGTLLMAIGAVLELRRRHAGAEPGV